MKVTIYGKPGCTYCKQAVKACELRGVEFEYLDLEAGDYTLEELQGKVPGPVRTLPQTFVDGKWVGGFTELAKVI